MRWCIPAAWALAALLAASAMAEEPAIGFGAAAMQGPDRPTVFVTTLEDSRPGRPLIPGSLRAALDGGNRTVRFRVSGNIRLVGSLPIRHPRVTIDGSDAPNGGVALWGYPLVIDADDVVIRHLRFRGSHPTESHDALAISGGRNILLDHISCSWATDECLDIHGYASGGLGTVRNVTIQHSLFAEAPVESSYGTLVDGDVADVTWYRNVFAKSANRNPQIATGRRRDSSTGRNVELEGVAHYELLQNVVYDAVYGTRIWNQSPTWTIELDVIGNLWKPGPKYPVAKVPIAIFRDPPSRGPIRVFAASNANPARGLPEKRDCDVFSVEPRNAPCEGWEPDHAARARQVTHHPLPPGRASEAFEEILAAAGATLPCRDAVDRRIVEEVRSGTGSYVGSPPPPLPDLTRRCR